MNFINGNEASFLTTLSEEKEEILQVPTPFAKKYLEKGDNKIQSIVLKTKSGVDGKVKYLKIKDGHYFIKGWLEFVKDNNLQNGDSIIFCVINSSSPNLIFEVFFYAKNGCSKNTTIFRTPTISNNAASSDGKKHSVEKIEASDDDDSMKNVDDQRGLMTLTKVIKNSYFNFMQLSKSFVKAAGIDVDYMSLQLENDEGKKWDVSLKKWGQDKVPHITKGWSKFLKDNNVEAGSSCDISHVKDNVLHVHFYQNEEGPVSKKKRRTS